MVGFIHFRKIHTKLLKPSIKHSEAFGFMDLKVVATIKYNTQNKQSDRKKNGHDANNDYYI